MILTMFLGLLILVVISIVIMYLTIVSKRQGTLPYGDILYTDLPKYPGENLHSKTLPLIGKPDFLIKTKDMILPVDIKTSKTPNSPHKSHSMQVLAYCLLIEENYNIRPTHGIISYPKRQFKIDYSDQNKAELIQLIHEVYQYKTKQKSFDITSIRSELCWDCRKELAKS